LIAELRTSSRAGNFTPDVVLSRLDIELAAGPGRSVELRFPSTIDRPRYAFLCLLENPAIAVHLSDTRVTGMLSLSHSANGAVAKAATQAAPPESGMETFEFWLPSRRPGGKNFALRIDPPLEVFEAVNVVNGIARPVEQPNAWVADPADPRPVLSLRWPTPQDIARVELGFDTDFDHPLESVLLGHPEQHMPFCVRDYRILDAHQRVLHSARGNYQTRNVIRFSGPVITNELHLEILGTYGAPAAVFDVRCYPPSPQPCPQNPATL
jgi:hypothetical protein